MRVSCLEGDTGFAAFTELKGAEKTIRVRLDGAEIRQPVTADDVEGFVLFNELDSDGRAQIDPSSGDRVWRRRVKGKVEIFVD